MNIIEAIHDENLFATALKGFDLSAWEPVLKAIFGLPMTEEERAIFTRLTDRLDAPTAPFNEAWFAIGRRGGKSRVAAVIGAYLACFVDYAPYLAPGQRGVVPIIAADRLQAREILSYVKGILASSPMLAQMVQNETAETIDLINNITIEILTGSYRTVRGRTVVAALLDEIAFWRSDDSANPDAEIVGALRPSMATIPNALMLGLSSPYRRAGVLWEAYRRYYGVESAPVLVLQAASRAMNPTLRQSFIDEEIEKDPAKASAEYFATFRDDISGFLAGEWIDRATRTDGMDLPPVPGRRYSCFVDPSGGRVDAFTMAIAHEENGRRIVDLVRGVPGPFNPEAVTDEFAATMFRYGIHQARSDRYGAEWVIQAFARHNVHISHSDKSKSEIYLEAEPAFATGQVEIPMFKKLIAELRHLERRVTKGGRDTVDHPPGGHDDHANAVCGAITMIAKPKIEPGIRSLADGIPNNDGRWQVVQDFNQHGLSRLVR